MFIVQENYQHSKIETVGSEIHAGRDVEKSVQGDAKRNEYNCIKEGVISRTMWNIGM